jgi:hypothetical protein
MKMLAAAAVLSLAFDASAQDAKLVMEEFMVPSGDSVQQFLDEDVKSQ